jgi:hypothetical protein
VAGIDGTHELGPGTGRVLVKTGRVGLAAMAGHDLTLEITAWSARVTVPDDGGDLSAATVTAELDLGSLAVREGSGGAKPLVERDRADIARNASKILGSGARASYASSRVIPSSRGATIDSVQGATIDGTLTLHGTSRPVQLRVAVQAPGRYRVTATVRQSDFGITPYSGFFGALKLRDEVTVELEVSLAG